MTAISIDPRLWPRLHPLLIAHDVGGSRDRSTAVVGGYCGYAPGILGIKEFSELPQDLYGSMRASALAQVDARYDRNALIVADLSNDSSYGEQLLETFGPRVIGVHIGPRGDGMTFERRPVGRGCLPIYHVGRSHLLEALHSDHAQLGGPSPPFGAVDRQDGGGTAAEAAAADPRMGCVYVTRLRHLAAPLSPSAPLIHVSKFARDSRAAQNIYVEGDHLR